MRPVGRRDAGLYTCQAQNSVGTSDPLSLQLDVKCKHYFYLICYLYRDDFGILMRSFGGRVSLRFQTHTKQTIKKIHNWIGVVWPPTR